MRKAISITLGEDNLLWLRGQAARTAKASVSEVLDQIVSEARASGRTDPSAIRSVAGTIDLPEDDPNLAEADTYIRSLFAASASTMTRTRTSTTTRTRAVRERAGRRRRRG